DRAHGVEDGAAGSHASGGSLKELELKIGKRTPPPTEIRPGGEDAQTRTGGIDEGAIEADEVRRQLAAVGVDDADVLGAEQRGVCRQLTGARLVDLHRDPLARQHRRLAPGRRAEVERTLPGESADGEPGQLGAAALRPNPAFRERDLVDAGNAPRTV